MFKDFFSSILLSFSISLFFLVLVISNLLHSEVNLATVKSNFCLKASCFVFFYYYCYYYYPLKLAFIFLETL
jgi:hypothetical protein